MGDPVFASLSSCPPCPATGHAIMRIGHLYFLLYFTLLFVVTYSRGSRVLGSSPVRTGDSLTSGKEERLNSPEKG